MAKRKQGSVIVPQEYETVSVDALKPHPRNVNQGDLGAIVESIDANGFYGAVIAQQSTGYILAGNYRWRAAVSQGMKFIPVLWVDVDDATALRIMLADNRTTRLGLDDPAGLATLLQEIRSDAGTLQGTGFDAEALQELLSDMTGEMGLESGSGDSGSGAGRSVTCPECGCEFTA
jgi:ParB-like chromosome segregation protein Spo0J